MSVTDPPSPCISVCRLDDDGVCEGCLRTIDEIAAWGGMPGEHKRAILTRIAAQRGSIESGDGRAQGPRPTPPPTLTRNRS